MPFQRDSSAYTVIVTASGASPETTDDIIPTTKGKLVAIHVHHDGTNNPTVELFDGTVAAGTSIYKRVFTLTDNLSVHFDDMAVNKLSAQTTVGAGTMSVTVTYKR